MSGVGVQMVVNTTPTTRCRVIMPLPGANHCRRWRERGGALSRPMDSVLRALHDNGGLAPQREGVALERKKEESWLS